jgi:4-amino-4-deoxy-L-arabinose transferase-like glycosyltransferase
MISETLGPAPARTRLRVIPISISKYWDRFAILAIVIVSAVLNFYGLNQQGYGNAYYAAAVRSMSQNWHNFFFASFDPAGFVTIDKPPLGFWFQVASVKLFGFNGVALMLPQALAGVLSVALLYHLVSRHFGKVAGLIAALALAVTPISVVTARDNTIDSTLVLAVLLGAWAIFRAAETGKLRWLLLCAVFVGLGFNIKMLQAYLVLPAFGLMYLVGAHLGWRRRISYLLLAAAVLITVSFSWVTAVDLTPASQRPWVDSTTTNSELVLAIGYNGLQRLTGNTFRAPGAALRGSASQTASGGGATTTGGGPGGVSENGYTGPLRLLNTELGSQIGWLLPLAVIGFLVAAWQVRPRRRSLGSPGLADRRRSLVLWSTWLLTTGWFFSIAGFYHTYYLVMVAPAIAALSGIGIVSLWKAYRASGSKTWWLLPASLLAVAAVQVHLLADYPAWARSLTPLIIGTCVLSAVVLAIGILRPRLGVRAMVPAVLLALIGLMAAPTAWAANSVTASNMGAILHAGPTAGTNNRLGLAFGGPPGGNFRPPNGGAGFGPPIGTDGRAFRGGVGIGEQVDSALLKYLEQHQGNATFLFATTSSRTAEPYIIATGKAVMATGGFSGSDPILTTANLAALLKQGTVRYFLLGGGGFGGPGGDTNGGLTSWVQSNCTVVPASKYSSTGTSSGSGAGSLYDCGAAK